MRRQFRAGPPWCSAQERILCSQIRSARLDRVVETGAKAEGIDMITVSPSTTKSEFFESLLDTEPSQASRSFGMMTAESVANSILKAICRGKRELILSPGGKALVWLSRLAPQLTDNLLLKYAA